MSKPKRLTATKAIRKNCLTCSVFQPSEIDRCTVIDCSLWPWRYGLTPEAAAKRGKQVNPYDLSGKSYSYPDGGPGTYKEIEKPLWWELPTAEAIKNAWWGCK